MPDSPFGGNRKHFDADVDGGDVHDQWSDRLRGFAASSERGVERFLAKKGDILVWHADLRRASR
ncbi:hypothetical protein [Paraburkholderia phosphatilytica]|uniref:hypothetical protein n=1 Tax=Paraburkholderia phosphatilytica TaxID=2282883 RepID=UPI000E4C94E6|nr:hypothetical protein [Paraburkholderia phosphatilytica]